MKIPSHYKNLDVEEKTVNKLINKDNFNEDYIMTAGTRADEDRVENPVATSAGIYSFHATCIKYYKSFCSLYDNATIYLERKYELYKIIKEKYSES